MSLGIQDTINMRVSGSDGVGLAGSSVEIGTTRLSVDVSLAAGATNQLVSIAWTVANTQNLFIMASQNVTLKVNSSSSPTQTINLKAGIPLEWRASAGYYTNLFATNVTAWYLTTTAAARVQASILTT